MLITVGSKNPVKIKATRKAFRKYWPGEKIVVEKVTVESGVANQPMSDEECIQGATTRAKAAQKKTCADFGVGLEGGVIKTAGCYFARAWIAVVDKEGNIGLGSSLSAPLGEKFIQLIYDGRELGEANDMITGRKNTKHKEGYFGLISNNLITRERGYTDGVLMALAKFKNPDLFK